MQLTEQAIKEYQDIHFKVKGERISYEKALEKGLKLVLLAQTVSKNNDKLTETIQK